MDPIAVDIGPLRLGVQVNDAVAEGWVRALLTRHVVDDREVGANVKVSVGRPPAGTGGPRALHLLYRHSVREVRTASLGRILRALPAQLEAYLPPPDGVVRLNAKTVVGDGWAALVDRRLVEAAETGASRLLRRGIRMVDAPFAEVDARSGDLRLAATGLEVDPLAAADLELAHPRLDDELALDELTVPIRHVIALDLAVGSPGERLVGISALVTDATGRLCAPELRVLARFEQDGLVSHRRRLTTRDLLELLDPP